MANKANTSRSTQQGKNTSSPESASENRGMELPPARPVRQRQRSPIRPPDSGAPAPTGRPAVNGRDGPPHGRSEADRSETSNDADHESDASGETPGYSVGYGKPPKHAQFKKGQSGNPAGQSPGSRNLRTIYLQERDARIDISENGRRRKIPKIEVLMKQTFKDALNGNPRARDAVLKLESLYGTDERLHPLQGSSGALPEDAGTQDERDAELLAEFKQWILEQEDSAEAHPDPETCADRPSACPEQPARNNGNVGDCSDDPDTAELPDDDPEPSPGQPTPEMPEEDDDKPARRPLRAFRDGEWH